MYSQEMVKSVYDFDPRPLGHGASGEGTKASLNLVGMFVTLCIFSSALFAFLLQFSE
jgi:hypothetical protein